MLLVEDLPVLFVRKSSDEHARRSDVVGAIAAALLIELADRGRIRVARDDAPVVGFRDEKRPPPPKGDGGRVLGWPDTYVRIRAPQRVAPTG